MGIGLTYRSRHADSASVVGSTAVQLKYWHLSVRDSVQIDFGSVATPINQATPQSLHWTTGTGDMFSDVTPDNPNGGQQFVPDPSIWYRFDSASDSNQIFDRFRLIPPDPNTQGSDWVLQRYTRDGQVTVYERQSLTAVAGQHVYTWRPKTVYDPYDNPYQYHYSTGAGLAANRLDKISGPRGVEVRLEYPATGGGRSCVVKYYVGTSYLSDYTWSFKWDTAGILEEFTFPKTDYVKKATTGPLMDVGSPVTTDAARYVFTYDTFYFDAGDPQNSPTQEVLSKVFFSRDPAYTGNHSGVAGAVLQNTYVNPGLGTNVAYVATQKDRFDRDHTFSYTSNTGGIHVVYTRPETSSSNTQYDLDVNAEGNITRVTVTAGTRPRNTEPLSLTWLYGYTSCSCGKPSSITYPSGGTESFIYTHGKRTTSTLPDPSGTGTVVYIATIEGYNRGCRPKTFTPPAPATGMPGSASISWTYVWAPRIAGLWGEKPTRITQATSSIGLFDGGTQAISTETEVALDGRVSWVIDPDQQTYTYNYHLSGPGNKLLRRITRDPLSGDAAHLTDFEYTGLGEVSQIKEGPATQPTVTNFQPDAWGRAISAEVTPGSSSGQVNRVEYYRDRFENIAVMRRKNLDHQGNAPKYADGSGGGRAWVRNEWHYSYERLLDSYIDRRSLADGDDLTTPTALVNPWMVHYGYDYKANGELSKVTLPNGSENTYVVDGYGMLYQTFGDVTGTNVELGQLHYNSDLQLEKERRLAPSGTSYVDVTLGRNASGYVESVSTPTPSGAVLSEVVYDKYGRVFQRKVTGDDNALEALTQYDFDELGRVKIQKRQDLGTGAWVESSYLYSKRSQVLKFTSSLGRSVERGFDRYGRLVWTRDNLNGPATKQNEVELTYESGRDWVRLAVSKIFEETDAADPSAGARKDYHTSYEHDLLGRVIKQTRTGLTTGSHAALVSTYGYNSHGDLTYFKDPSQQPGVPDGDPAGYSSTVLDATGRWVEFVKQGGGVAAPKIRLESSYTDRMSGSTSSEVSRKDGKGFETRHQYDGLYRLANIYRPGYTTGPEHHTSIAYNAASMVSMMTDGNGTVVTNGYDSVGRIIGRSVQVSSPHVSSVIDSEFFTYDSVGRLKAQGSAYGTGIIGASSYERDKLGRIKSESFSYYGIDLAQPVTITSGYNFTGQSAGYGDPAFRRELGYSSGMQVRSTPDAVGRLKDLHVKMPGATTESHLARYRYSGGQINQRTQYFGNAANTNKIVSDLTFDGHRRLEKVTETLNPGTPTPPPIYEEEFGYDSFGNVLKHAYTKVGGAAGDLFEYDKFNRLIGAKLGVSAGGINGTYAAASAAKTVTYNLDPGNNRTSVVTQIAAQTQTANYTTESNSPRYATVSTSPTTFAYDGEGNLIWDGRFYMKYDFKNRLTEIYQFQETSGSQSSSSTTSRVKIPDPKELKRHSVPVASLRDAQQSIEKKSGGDLLKFLKESPKLATSEVDMPATKSSTSSSSTSTSSPTLVLIALYSYDTFNRRVYRSVPSAGVDDRYAYDGWREVEELTPTPSGTKTIAVAQKAFVWGVGIDAMVAYYRKESGSWGDYYPVQDSKGSVVALYDSAGASIEKVEYDPYGNATVHVGATQQAVSSKGNPYLFQGRRHDAETDFYYFRNRYLDSALGRFLTNDPVGIWGDSANLGNGLGFVANNPVTGSDPSGLTSLPIAMVGANRPIEPPPPNMGVNWLTGEAMALPPGILTSQGEGSGDDAGQDCACHDPPRKGWLRELGLGHLDPVPYEVWAIGELAARFAQEERVDKAMRRDSVHRNKLADILEARDADLAGIMGGMQTIAAIGSMIPGASWLWGSVGFGLNATNDGVGSAAADLIKDRIGAGALNKLGKAAGSGAKLVLSGVRMQRLSKRLRSRMKAIQSACNSGKRMSGITGRFSLGDSVDMGRAWVGSGARVMKGNAGLVSKDGKRLFRFPAVKRSVNKETGLPYSQTGVQANFELKNDAGIVISNVHIDIDVSIK